MKHYFLSIKDLLIVSVAVLIFFHILPRYHAHVRNSLLEDKDASVAGEYPSRISPEQQVYLDYLRNDTGHALPVRREIASGSVDQQYNLGTYLATLSVSSGEVRDLPMLQEAETYLSGAASLDTTANTELTHNLTTVRSLIKQHEEKNPEQKQEQQAGGSGEQQQQEQSGAEQQEQEQNNTQGGSGKEQGAEEGNQPQPSQLSASMKQQLEQYQQQLQGEQVQNQQFFDKRPPEAAQNDPFNALNQLFGGDPQFQQNLGSSGTKDW